MPDRRARLARALREHSGPVLAALCVVVLPFGRAVEAVVVLMAVAGLAMLAREPRRVLLDPAQRAFATAFALVWIPAAVSLVDAVEPGRSATVVAGSARFLLAGVFVVGTVRGGAAHDRVLRIVAWAIAAWCLDTLVQAAFGRDLLGYPAGESRLNGPFGERSPKLGISLAILAPLALAHAWRHWRRPGRWAAVVAIGAVVLLAGTRSAWVGAAVLAAAGGVVAWRRGDRPSARAVLAAALAALALGAALASLSPRFAARLEATAATLTGADTGANPLTHRLWIWDGALRMAADHPVNGVGARGFRYAFPRYAGADERFGPGTAGVWPTHSHQVLLEVAAETGLLGLAGLLACAAWLVRVALRASPGARSRLLPYGLALLVAYFPLNTHLAFFSSFFSQLTWWLVALYCAAAAREE